MNYFKCISLIILLIGVGCTKKLSYMNKSMIIMGFPVDFVTKHMFRKISDIESKIFFCIMVLAPFISVNIIEHFINYQTYKMGTTKTRRVAIGIRLKRNMFFWTKIVSIFFVPGIIASTVLIMTSKAIYDKTDGSTTKRVIIYFKNYFNIAIYHLFISEIAEKFCLSCSLTERNIIIIVLQAVTLVYIFNYFTYVTKPFNAILVYGKYSILHLKHHDYIRMN
ncbi:hypothetical protein A3Q56_05305 [Intoshia linei]|uniref:Uncharacterized protein n=1 Tax=Intoshia linei TaxID=1819745 RepID=A0A177AYA2_9BILA|nr:hypothetical protein A3Q56_05305 [Intoshia linei]